MIHIVPLRSRAGSVRVAVMATVASIAMGTLLAGPAAGAENKNDLLQLSRDGVTFATDAIPTMFGSAKGYVPGESRQRIIWVRNASNQPARLSLAVHNAGTTATSVLPGQLRLQARAPGRDAAAATLPSVGDCAPVIDDWTLAAGQALPLTLDLGMALDAPNSTRNQSAEFIMTIVLQEGGASQRVGACSKSFESPGTPPPGGSKATIAIGGASSGTVTGGKAAGGDDTLGSTGAEAGGNDSQTGPGPNADQSGIEPLPEALPFLSQLQSNVEATIYNPWPWIVVMSACIYIFASVRKRSRTR